jgi:drug/metabolite transporter (DMT)-like permease
LLPWAKLFCLVAAVGVAFILRHRTHSQHNWVRCRLAAEFCRSALATWGLPRATKLLQDVDLPSMRGLTRTLQVLHGRASASRSVSVDDFKRVYVAERIDDQLAYFTRQEDRASPLFIRFRAGFWIATLLALASTASYAVAYSLNADVPQWMQTTVFYFLPITLPVVAASLISLISINDLQRRVARYREMRMELEASRRQIGFCATWNSIERVVLKTERALLHEVLEWHSITSFAESH